MHQNLVQDLLEIYRNAFQKPEFGTQDNFFENGGNSITAVKIAGLAKKEKKLPLKITDIFQYQEIESLAEALTARMQSEHLENMSKMPETSGQNESFPVTSMQDAYLTGRKIRNLSSHYYTELETDSLDTNLLEQAIRHLVQKHDALRLVISPDGKSQKILSNVPEYVL
ncbi:MAG: hypothetical protein E7496_04850, partial [Ruminococcus sp.]|nr:hypothetical protein [Ruminococcus sp.]